ncbi:MAG: major facilitator superfamily 1 [Candidatus Eremiobacteraeota bacterium]|nr:major facilitator superfamily 1 [Candidatus Eremiobacteraeota bacterium]
MARPPSLVVPALYLATTAAFADMYITQPLLPQLSTDFGISAATAGLTISAVVLTTAVSSSAYGPLSEVLGRRSLMVWGSLLLALATFACGFAPSFGTLVALRGLQGLLVPCISALAVAYIHDDLAGHDAGTVVGGYVAASVAGGLTGRIVSGLVADAYGWHAAFGVFAGATLAGALALAFTLQRGSARPSRVRAMHDLSASYAGMWGHLRDARLVGAFAIGAALFFGFIGIFTYLPFYLTAAPFHLTTAAVAWLYASYLAGVLVSPIAGRLSGTFSKRLVMAAGIAIAMVAMLALLAHALIVIVVACVVLCAGMFIAQPVAPMFVARTAGEAKASATALYQSFYYLGAVFGSTLPGLAWERWAWPGVVWTCVASLVVALLADLLLCGRVPARQPELGPVSPRACRGALVNSGATRQNAS